MIYGLYLSAQGADAQSTQLDVISNNLANAQTSSFKRDLALFQARQPHDVRKGIEGDVPGNVNNSTGGVEVSGVVTDYSQGPLLKTDSPLDVALTGPGFMQVEADGQTLLTRNGSLAINEIGQLVTASEGHTVLDSSGGSIEIPPDAARVEITPDGLVAALDQQGARLDVGQLGLVEPESYHELIKHGNSLYESLGETIPVVRDDPAAAEFRQGFLEGSGTQSVTEMMRLIETSRAFETNINMIKYQDDALGQLLQVVAR